MSRMSGFTGETSHNFFNILDGDEAAVNVAVPGAQLGDFALVSMDIDVENLQLRADVTAADRVTVVASNSTGASVNLGLGIIRGKVIPFDVI